MLVGARVSNVIAVQFRIVVPGKLAIRIERLITI